MHTTRSIKAHDVLKLFICDRELHYLILNRYRHNEQKSCTEIIKLIEILDGRLPELGQQLSNHVLDEARHAMWLTELLVHLNADISVPIGSCYINIFEHLLTDEYVNRHQDIDDGVIYALAALNITERRVCQYFSAHIDILKSMPQSKENILVRNCIEKIFPEEKSHVKWSSIALKEIASFSTESRHKVQRAKHSYLKIEKAAFEAEIDLSLGAELRRTLGLIDVANTLPLWERPQYLLKRLPQTLIAPDLHESRIHMVKLLINRDYHELLNKFLPLFINGIPS